MKSVKELLELRTKIKNKKPDFIRQDTHLVKGLEVKWRKPKGVHSKIRHNIKGKRKMPSPGYRSPSKVRGMHASGLKQMVVHSISELGKIEPKEYGVILAATVGMRKKTEMIKKAKEYNLTILNIDSEKYLKKAEEIIEKKKMAKEKAVEKKVKDKGKDTEKENKDMKPKEDKEKESKSTTEIQKTQEKKEIDKILTKK